MPKNFRKGEYIVIIYDGLKTTNNQFSHNYLYKQRKVSYYLQPEIDGEGSTTNGLDSVKYDSFRWRNATPKEINRYNRRKKPYDVTTIETAEDLLYLLDELEDNLKENV